MGPNKVAMSDSDVEERLPKQLGDLNGKFVDSPRKKYLRNSESKPRSKVDAMGNSQPKFATTSSTEFSKKTETGTRFSEEEGSGRFKAEPKTWRFILPPPLLRAVTRIATSIVNYAWNAARGSVQPFIVRSALQAIFSYFLAVTLVCMIPGISWFPQYAGICPAQGFGFLGKGTNSPRGCDTWPFNYYLKHTPHCNLIVSNKTFQSSSVCTYYPTGFLGFCPAQHVLDKEDTEKAVAVMFDDVGSIAQYANAGGSFVYRYSRGSKSIFILSHQVKRSTLEDRHKISDALFLVYEMIQPLTELMIDFESSVNTMAYMVRECIKRLDRLIKDAEKRSGGFLSEQEEKNIAHRFFRETHSIAKDIERLEEESRDLQRGMGHFKRALDAVHSVAADDLNTNKAALASRQGVLVKLFDTFSAEEYKKTEEYKRHFEILERINQQYDDGWAEAHQSFQMITRARKTLGDLSKAFSYGAHGFYAESIHYLIVRIKDKINVLKIAMATNDKLQKELEQGEHHR